MGLGNRFPPQFPIPDAVLSVNDRAHLLGLYAGYTPSGGSSFDYQYSLSAGDHPFFSKVHRRSMVIPNYFVVASPEVSGNTYTGFASDPDSASFEMRKYFELNVTSNAQATSIAAAMLQHAQLQADKGFAEVPMNVGQELYDYIKITDSRQDDYRTGNVGYIRRVAGGGQFKMEIQLGSPVFSGLAALAGLGGLPGAPGTGTTINQTINNLIQLINQLISTINEILTEIENIYNTLNSLSTSPYSALLFDIDGGGAEIVDNTKAWLQVPWDCTIISYSVTSDVSGSIQLDVWADDSDSFPPTVADTIVASVKPTLTSQRVTSNALLTGWTVRLYQFDYVMVNVDSCTTIQKAVLRLLVRKI